MEIFLDGISSLDYYRTPGTSSPMTHPAKRYAREFASSVPTQHAACAALLACPFLRSPLHLLVPNDASRCRAKGIDCHVLSTPLPPAAFLPIGDGLFACSPEFAFARCARELDFAQLVALGCEMTGSYRLQADDAQGFVSAPPLTSAPRLRAFLDQRGFACARHARDASRFVCSGSASPRETLLFALLSLPKAKGGYGLPFPQFNYEVAVPRSDWRVAFGKKFSCDLFWPSARFGVEYDSDAFHTSAQKIVHDARRRNALLSLGITIITATREQATNRFGLDQIAAQVAKGLGIRLRMERVNRTAQEALLRSLLGPTA